MDEEVLNDFKNVTKNCLMIACIITGKIGDNYYVNDGEEFSLNELKERFYIEGEDF